MTDLKPVLDKPCPDCPATAPGADVTILTTGEAIVEECATCNGTGRVPLSEEDDYHGNSGWVVVATGDRGRSCFMAIDPGFGALRCMVSEHGISDPEEALDGPLPNEGVYRATASAWSSRSYEGEHDWGIRITSDWVEVPWPLPAHLAAPTPRVEGPKSLPTLADFLEGRA